MKVARFSGENLSRGTENCGFAHRFLGIFASRVEQEPIGPGSKPVKAVDLITDYKDGTDKIVLGASISIAAIREDRRYGACVEKA